ncbi:MAG: hypothetical protein M3Y65_05535 [Pseudomonadota bacterium]|nr:hypothetical protein [Pseudomonadota bacterium]
MQTANNTVSGQRSGTGSQPNGFSSLDQETRSHVDTACASFHLNRRPQTMRAWASTEAGPIRPVRINKRLAWAVADIKRLLGGEVA